MVVDHNCRSSVPHIYAAGDLSGTDLLSSVAAMQGRKIAEHAMGLHHNRPHRHIDYSQAASAMFTEPEIAEVGLTEAEATGRKIRVTKMPFSVTPKALINNDPRGFLKLVSDPATGVVLGGSIVGGQAAELISVVALAVTQASVWSFCCEPKIVGGPVLEKSGAPCIWRPSMVSIWEASPPQMRPPFESRMLFKPIWLMG